MTINCSRMIKKLSILTIIKTSLLFVCMVFFFISCGEGSGIEPISEKVTPSMTIGAEKITAISAQLKGKANLGTSVSSDLAMGIMWSKESGVLPSNSKKVEATNMDNKNNYTVPLISLEPETTYYYRSYVSQNGKVTGQVSGPTVVKATANDGSGVSASCVVWCLH